MVVWILGIQKYQLNYKNVCKCGAGWRVKVKKSELKAPAPEMLVYGAVPYFINQRARNV